MKKTLAVAMLMFVGLAARAQFYAGGTVGWYHSFDEHRSGGALLPEGGYQVDEHWTAGLTMGYINDRSTRVKEDPTVADENSRTKAFILEPYARYTVFDFGRVSVFVDGVLGLATSKTSSDSESRGSMRLGVRPGASVKLGKHFSFVTHVGFLGYGDSRPRLFKNGYGFDFEGGNVSFGAYYNF